MTEPVDNSQRCLGQSNRSMPDSAHERDALSTQARLVPDCRTCSALSLKSCASASVRVRCRAAARHCPALAQTAVDLELVIAVDVSLSMDLDEQRLQRDGYVAGLPRSGGAQGHRLGRQRPHRRHLHGMGRPAHAAGRHPLDRDRQRRGRARLRRPAGGGADLARAHDVDLRRAAVLRAPVRHERRQGHPPRHRRLGRRPQQRRRAGGAACATSWSPRASSSTACRSCSSWPRASSTSPISTATTPTA